MKTKGEIVNVIKGFGFPNSEVVISLDDFFDNINCTNDSIGCNIYPNPPAPEKFHQLFKELISSKKANEILVRISDIDYPENWFFTDTVYIISTLSSKEMKECMKSLSPDEIIDGWMYGKPANVVDLEEGQKVYSIWWD